SANRAIGDLRSFQHAESWVIEHSCLRTFQARLTRRAPQALPIPTLLCAPTGSDRITRKSGPNFSLSGLKPERGAPTRTAERTLPGICDHYSAIQRKPLNSIELTELPPQRVVSISETNCLYPNRPLNRSKNRREKLSVSRICKKYLRGSGDSAG